MPERKRSHLTYEDRVQIEEGIREGRSARGIARRVSASPSTVTREVRANRAVRERKRRAGANVAVRCARYGSCERRGSACASCPTPLAECRHCRARQCVDSCPGFERKMCPATESWPYVCPAGCPKRAHCGYPTCSYDARSAHDAYRERLSSSRSGISLTEEELAAMDALVTPLVRQGQSFEAIWATHGDELPVGARTAYNYQAAGALSCADIELPRKVRVRPRRRAGDGSARDRVDRSGATYDDFLALPLAEQARAVEADSVCGLRSNSSDVLSLMPVATGLQLYLLKRHGDPAATVAALDAVERAVGSCDAFRAALGLILADRGVEFDDRAGMERSCLEPGRRRCRVYYCDPMESNQKSRCERNHEQLRRILPKGRSDFDRLSEADVALACSHVNSYPLARLGGRCPLELAAPLFPAGALEGLGVRRVEPDLVTLRPSLLPHAVAQ